MHPPPVGLSVFKYKRPMNFLPRLFHPLYQSCPKCIIYLFVCPLEWPIDPSIKGSDRWRNITTALLRFLRIISFVSKLTHVFWTGDSWHTDTRWLGMTWPFMTFSLRLLHRLLVASLMSKLTHVFGSCDSWAPPPDRCPQSGVFTHRLLTLDNSKKTSEIKDYNECE